MVTIIHGKHLFQVSLWLLGIFSRGRSQFLSRLAMPMTDFTLVKDERTYIENGICMHLGRSGPLRNIEMLSPHGEKDGE